MGQLAKKRVLVVEDEFLIATDIEKMLGDFGIEVVGPASSLQSALYLARTEDLDGAVLDVKSGRWKFRYTGGRCAFGTRYPVCFCYGLQVVWDGCLAHGMREAR